jgi:hypothetical protein
MRRILQSQLVLAAFVFLVSAVCFAQSAGHRLTKPSARCAMAPTARQAPGWPR